MKKSFVFSVVFFLLCGNYIINAQLTRFVKEIKKNVEKEVVVDKDKNTKRDTLPEPACACDQAMVILNLGDKFKVDYSEISITSDIDGNLLAEDRINSTYYIVKDGVTKGPYAKGDPALAAFGISNDDNKDDALILKYKDYISKTGDRYLITFMGKKYGPYDRIDQFIVTKSKEKFVAMATENSVSNEDQGLKMEKEMQNAKTDEERMKIAMKVSQEMQSNIMKKGINTMVSKFITNIPDAIYDPMKTPGLQFSGNIKFDEILLYAYDKIMDLKGNLVMTPPQSISNIDNFFISSDNSRWATYSFGTLTFNDKSTLPDVFNIRLIKADGKIYLAYMYYSPKRNSIMQCKVPF
jgi:hypothetical protein